MEFIELKVGIASSKSKRGSELRSQIPLGIIRPQIEPMDIIATQFDSIQSQDTQLQL